MIIRIDNTDYHLIMKSKTILNYIEVVKSQKNCNLFASFILFYRTWLSCSMVKLVRLLLGFPFSKFLSLPSSQLLLLLGTLSSVIGKTIKFSKERLINSKAFELCNKIMNPLLFCYTSMYRGRCY
jgi:hypothetical protein